MIGDETMEVQIKCSKCDFEDEFVPDSFGLSYYQSVGLCPHCDSPMIYFDETPTKEVITLKYEG